MYMYKKLHYYNKADLGTTAEAHNELWKLFIKLEYRGWHIHNRCKRRLCKVSIINKVSRISKIPPSLENSKNRAVSHIHTPINRIHPLFNKQIIYTYQTECS